MHSTPHILHRCHNTKTGPFLDRLPGFIFNQPSPDLPSREKIILGCWLVVENPKENPPFKEFLLKFSATERERRPESFPEVSRTARQRWGAKAYGHSLHPFICWTSAIEPAFPGAILEVVCNTGSVRRWCGTVGRPALFLTRWEQHCPPTPTCWVPQASTPPTPIDVASNFQQIKGTLRTFCTYLAHFATPHTRYCTICIPPHSQAPGLGHN